MNRVQNPQRNTYGDENSKIEYLQTENSQQFDQIQELSNLLALNRQALRIMSSAVKKTTFSPVHSDEKDSDRSNSMNSKGLLMVMKNLQEENDLLQKQIDKVVIERNQAQNQVLINEQIAEAAQRHEKELTQELEQRIKSLNSQIQSRDQQLLKLEQIKPTYDDVAGIVIKYRDIISPDTAIMRLHDEIESLSDQVVQDQKKIESQKKDKQDLQNLNFKLTTQILKMKTTPTPQNSHGKYIQLVPEDQSLPTLMNFQKKMLQTMNESSVESSEQEGSLIMSPLPLRNDVSQQQQKVPGLGIPKLDLTKAKQIQEINAKRQIQQMQDKQNKCIDFQVMERIQKLEKSIDDCRRNLQREMILNKALETNKEDLTRLNQEIEHRNQILSKSNIYYEETWRKINKQYHYLQQFYILNKDLLNTQQTQTQTHSHNRQPSQAQQENKFSGIIDNKILLEDASFHLNDNLEKPLYDSFRRNIDFQEEIQEGDGLMKKNLIQYYPEVEYFQQFQQSIEIQQNLYQYYVPGGLKDARKFLLGVAKDMYMGLTTKLEQMNNQPIELNPAPNKIKRSLSDITDYQYQQGTYQKQIINEIFLPDLSDDQEVQPIELSLGEDSVISDVNDHDI